jgi:predicted unusual protein kinase regulating ubiquinone biosynthesis (AarF/ABC1/UbiB family)
VPEVVGERSSKRVLTLTYIPGRHFSELMEGPEAQDLRDRIGTLLCEMLTSQLFELNAIHGDPNPANFAWTDQGQLVVYDFGCVKRYHPEALEPMKDLVIASAKRDYSALDDAMHSLGRLRPDRDVPPEYYDRWLDAIALPLFEEEVFDYGASDIGTRVKRLIPGAMKRAHWWQPAPELAILDRAIGGAYDNLKNMGARVPVRQLVFRYCVDQGSAVQVAPESV